jgi:hypothetical protein
MEDKKEKAKKEKEQKKDSEKEKAEKKARAAAEAKVKLIPPGKQKAVHRPEIIPGPKAKPDDKSVGLGDELGEGLVGDSEGAEGEVADGQASQEAVPEEPPPKKPLPRKLYYGLAIIVFGVSIVLYDHRLFTIPDVLWFVPFLLVVLGLMRVWKMGLYDRWGQTMLLGGIVLHFALLVFIEGNKTVPRITVPVLVVWTGILVFIRGFQAWWRSRQPEEPVEITEEPRKERKRWTYADMNELLVEAGELPKPDPVGEPGAPEQPGQKPETTKGAEK